MKTPLFVPIVLLPVLLLAGCNNRLFFATETRAGLNVAGSATSPGSVSLDYHRGEVAYIPKNDQGKTYSVYGGGDYDFSWASGLILSQTFATGDAAIIATGGMVDKPSESNMDGPLYFATGTTYGLDLRFADVTTQTPGMIVGYQRAEAVVIPTSTAAPETSPVYADISIVSLKDADVGNLDGDRKPREKKGARIKQSFGTGEAARILATKASVKAKLAAAAGLDVSKTIGKSTASLVARTNYATELGGVTDAATQQQILTLAAATLKDDGISIPADYDSFINVIVPNLFPDTFTKLQNALKAASLP